MIARLRQAAWPIGVGMAGVAIYALLQVTKPQPDPSIEPPRPIRVEVVPAIRATTRPTVVAYGEVRPGVRHGPRLLPRPARALAALKLGVEILENRTHHIISSIAEVCDRGEP